MPRKILRSAGHAWDGLCFAVRSERNLRLFLSGLSLVVALGLFMKLRAVEWIAILLSCGLFISTELLNTSIERIADAVDDHCKAEHRSHCFTALKHSKDIAAAASLISLLVVVVTLLIVFLPHAKLFCETCL